MTKRRTFQAGTARPYRDPPLPKKLTPEQEVQLEAGLQKLDDELCQQASARQGRNSKGRYFKW